MVANRFPKPKSTSSLDNNIFFWQTNTISYSSSWKPWSVLAFREKTSCLMTWTMIPLRYLAKQAELLRRLIEACTCLILPSLRHRNNPSQNNFFSNFIFKDQMFSLVRLYQNKKITYLIKTTINSKYVTGTRWHNHVRHYRPIPSKCSKFVQTCF